MLTFPNRILLAATSVGVLSLVGGFVQPFGVRSPQTPTVNSQFLCPSFSKCASPSFSLGAKGEDEDDDWEPDEAELLNGIEDITLDDDVDVDVEDTTMVVVNEDPDGSEEKIQEVVEDDDDDDDDDDIEVEDIWEEDEEEDDIVEEVEGEFEEWEEGEEGPSSYLGGEVDYEYEDWEEDEGYANVPLEDDPNDPNYMAQKKLVEETVARREQVQEDKDFDALDYAMNKLSEEEIEILDSNPFIQEFEKMASELIVIDEDDVKDMDLKEEMAMTSDLMFDDPYEDEGEEDILGTGISDSDMKEYDGAFKRIQESLKEEPWDKVNFVEDLVNFDELSEETVYEMDACLDEIGGSAYNSTRWLMYDLNFNVSNLILAAVKHNPQAPIIFQHWFPQLVAYSRYSHARERNFDFNWDDVDGADMEELERYYLGFGYTEIPSKAPAETGIIGFEDLDEEELKMAAFENWMTEVYNPEWDRKDFDDDNFRDEDNVFSDFYEAPQHPDLPTFEDAQEDLQGFNDDMDEEGENNKVYRDFMGKDFQYQYVDDDEFKQEFRGHLVVACTPSDEDLEVAERITLRMAEEFGKQIYVETRVLAHAREEDSVFEVWLESYEIDLLHSKKRAAGNAEGWDGPAEVDDVELSRLVEEVRFLISDEARYSYRFETDIAV